MLDRFLKYIEDYTEKFELSKHIQYSKFVLSVKRLSPDLISKWEVKTCHYNTKAETTELFDHVIIANGHFSVPTVPEIKGREKFEGKIMHVHDYRDPFKQNLVNPDSKVLIVGASFSAIDMIQ